MSVKPLIAGPKNLITDVVGIHVGNADDADIKTGVTAVICQEPAVASVVILGGAPGTRETDLLAPENLVDKIDGLFLAGGSTSGLDAGSGVQAKLREMGRGFEIGPHRIPIVPGAILFDLINGGDKNWGRYGPYRELGYQAAERAGPDFDLGSSGAGTGAQAAICKGGLGSASTVLDFGDGNIVTIGALVAVNPVGNPLVGESGHFWAAPFELDGEFGGRGLPQPFPQDAMDLRIKHRAEALAGANTTIAIIATDARLNKPQAKRLAIAAHNGIARAIWPSHTPFDGDLVFALATGKSNLTPDADQQIDMGAAATSTLARAIARGVYMASATDNDLFPTWQEKYG